MTNQLKAMLVCSQDKEYQLGDRFDFASIHHLISLIRSQHVKVPDTDLVIAPIITTGKVASFL